MRKILPALLFSILAVALIASGQSFNGASFYGAVAGSGSFTAGGDLSGTSSSQTVIGINGTSLAGLATGLLRNTTTTGVPTIATAAQILSACTGCAPIASPTFTGTQTLPLPVMSGKCAADGSAANPSLVACSGSSSGAFSCHPDASTGTCIVSSTAVTTTSVIVIQPEASDGTLSSCGNTADTGLTAQRLASQTTGSFTINVGTYSTKVCFKYAVL